MGYSTMQLAISAASAGAYLTDLLHMRSYETGPMCVTNPDDFLKACQGMSVNPCLLKSVLHTFHSMYSMGEDQVYMSDTTCP